MRWKLYAAVTMLVALGVAGLFTVWPAGHRPSTAETMTVAESRQIMSALLYIALAERYCADEGLEVILQPHPSGKASLRAVIDSKADIAAVAEVPFMWAVLERRPVQVFATIETTDKDIAITARTEAGIKAFQDLPGKRIGIIPGTSSAYFLDLFLVTHGLKGSGVVVEPFEPTDIAPALAAGSIDAMSAWTAIRLQAHAQLPDRTVSFFGDGVYIEAWNLAARKTFRHERPAAMQKLLRALLKAERFAGVNRQQAIDIVARQLNLDRRTLAILWENFGFTIGLDQALIVNLEGQARAAAQANPTVLLPNFLHHVHRDGLAAVAPHRVSILY
jgi:ABC-type nitrate/sulfonate/bicarbonate transport system substrate-binding protein